MNMDENEDTRRAERQRDIEEKFAQNKMPEWHTRSTIDGSLTALGNQQAMREQDNLARHVLDSLNGAGTSKEQANGAGSPMEGVIKTNGMQVDVKPKVHSQAERTPLSFCSTSSHSRQSTTHTTPPSFQDPLLAPEQG
jgi:hypothetical protein